MLNNVCAAADASLGIYADLGCAAVLLLFLIIGLSKGFVNQIFGLLGSIAALVLAGVLCGTVVNALNGSLGVVDSLAESLGSNLGNAEWLTWSINENNIREACNSINLPEFIADFAVEQAANVGTVYSNLGELISHTLANIIVSGIAYVVLFAVLKFVIFLFKKIFEKLVTLPGLHSADKLLGSVLGLIKGVIAVYVILFFLSIIPVEGAEEFFSSVKQAINESSVASFFANNNLFAKAIAWMASKVGLSL